MDYSEVREAFFQPSGVRAADLGTAHWTSPARRLRDAVEPIATIFAWGKPAYDAYEALGLDFLTGFVRARGSLLGDPDPAVVVAALGVFEPSMIEGLYDAGRAICTVEAIRTARAAGVAASLRAVLGDADVEPIAVQLRRAAETVAVTGRPLFAAALGQPWPTDDMAKLWLAAMTLRELRGDSHLAACAAAGLTGLEANIMTERQVGWPRHEFTATRGWATEVIEAAEAQLQRRGLISADGLTDDGARLRSDIEERTDRQVQPMIDALGADLEPIIGVLDGWAGQIIEHGWFPSDVRKRASG